MSVLDPFALGGFVIDRPIMANPAAVDAKVLTLFQQWIAESRSYDVASKEEGDSERPASNAVMGRMDELEVEILAHVGGGPVTMAVKAYFLARLERDWTPDDATVKRDPDSIDSYDALKSLIRDAAVVVPEIGEFCAPMIHCDAALIAADIDAGWCQDRLKERERTGPHPRDLEWIVGVRKKLAEHLAFIAEREAKTPRGQEIKDRHRDQERVAAGGFA